MTPNTNQWLVATPKIKIRKRDTHTHTPHSRYTSTQESRRQGPNMRLNPLRKKNLARGEGGAHRVQKSCNSRPCRCLGSRLSQLAL